MLVVFAHGAESASGPRVRADGDEAEPGEHTLVSTTGDSIDTDGSARLVAEAGHRYWLHQDFDNVLGFITDKLQWVDEARWRELFDEGSCDYKVLSGVPGNESLSGALPFARASTMAAPAKDGSKPALAGR